MAKPKHPTAKTLRQGQTVYHVVDSSIWMGEENNDGVQVIGYFMFSHKTPLPPVGSRIESMPVSHARNALIRVGISNKTMFYSRKRAESAAREKER